MKLNLENFDIRRSQPTIVDNYRLPENFERYILKGEGLIGIDIFKGDKVKITNSEGGQICEVVLFDLLGNNNQSIIDNIVNGDAKYIKYVLTNGNDKKTLLKKLRNKKIDFNNCKSTNFFNYNTIENEHVEFIIHDEGFILFAAPGEAMNVDKQNAPTDLEILIEL